MPAKNSESEEAERIPWTKGLTLYRRLWPELRPELRAAGWIGLLMLITVPSGVLSPLLVQRIFDDVLPNRDGAMLLTLSGWIVGLNLLAAGFQYLQSLIALGIQARVRFRIARKVFDHLFKLPLSYFHKTETGYLMSQVRDDVGALDSLLPSTLAQGVVNILRAVLFLILLLMTDVGLAVSGFALVVVLFGFVLLVSPSLRRRSEGAREADAKSSGALHEAFSGLVTVRTASYEGGERRRVSRFVKMGLRGALRRDVLGEITNALMGLIGSLGLYAIISVGAYRIMSGDSTVGGLFAFSIYLSQLVGATGSVFYLVPSIQAGLASLSRLHAILDTPVEKDLKERGARGAMRGAVRFESVNFSYDEETSALKAIDLDVKPGEMIAIVGRSGAGKSTLVSLISRLYEVTEGVISIDGRPVQDWSLKKLREQIGVVPQEVFLFNRSVRENIAYSKEHAVTEAELVNASQLAHADVFIQKLPKGYDTIVGERGVRLSGGERQRLAIAREILRDPPIMVFDEATSSLDSESEGLIQDAMAHLMLNRTSFVIAHRLSTIRSADRILVLDDGCVVGLGPHEELLETCDLYRMLHERQSFKASSDSEG